ncbi:MAG TPA: DNA primase [Spirochaetota bacterium]|nr:DNA primase [Spirochaetota bacterium]HPQ48953.1 DNA primase [Spirochaetota bacterium]
MELKDIIDNILSKVNISEIIGKYIDIKKRGTNYFALCPFHNEKTPSFSINDEKRIYKCFGCGKTGNAISFLMEYKGLNFNQALREVAKHANIEIDSLGFKKLKKKIEFKEKITEINKKIAMEYYQLLLKTEKALKYIKDERKIESAIINKFMLGYAPPYDIITQKFKSFKDDLFETGAINKKNNTFTDRFKDKIIFPIFDIDNTIIAFGSRVLDNSKPKYINSPETKIFKKREVLYGLNFAIESVKESKKIYVVEGYFDLLMMHQIKITNSIATLGTALSKEHINILKKYVEKVVLVFDGDEAGYKACTNGVKICIENDMESEIVILPENLDPFDFIVLKGSENFKKFIQENSKNWDDFLLEPIIKTDKIIDKKKKTVEVLKLIKDTNELTKSIILKKISEITGINIEKMEKYIENIKNKNNDNISKNIKKTEEKDPIKETEIELLLIIINNPMLYLDNNDKIDSSLFENSDTAKIFEAFKNSFIEGIFKIELFISLLGELKKIIENGIQNPKYMTDPEKQIKDTLLFLKIMKIKKRKEAIIKKIKEIGKTNEEITNKLNYELYLLSKEENEIKKNSNLLIF